MAQIGVVSASRAVTVESHRVASNFVHLYGARNVTFIPLEGDGQAAAALLLVRQQTGIFIVEDSGMAAKVSFLDLLNARLANQTGLFETPDGVVAYESPSQNRLHLVETLGPSQVMAAIEDVLDRGGMVAGNCGMMSQSPVILGGDSMGALLAGTSIYSWPNFPPVYRLAGGLGLIKGFLLDSDLSERGREIRLIRALLDTKDSPYGTARGLGIDQNTALVVADPLGPRPIGKVIFLCFVFTSFY